MAAAAPFALKAAPYAASAFAGLFGKKLAGPSTQQRAAMTGTQTAAGTLGAAAPPLIGQGTENLGATGNYYKNILGSRSAATAALTPETTSALDYYKGAQGKVDTSMRGGSRDYANAELERQKVGQLASYLPQARMGAAQGAAGVGGTQVGAGTNAAATSGYLGNALFNQGSYLQDQARQGGNTVGKFIFDILSQIKGGKKKIPSGGITAFDSNLGIPSF